MTWLAVAVGGALGSMARHRVNLEIAYRWERLYDVFQFHVGYLHARPRWLSPCRVAQRHLAERSGARACVGWLYRRRDASLTEE
jgi:hypothetical protein